MDSKPPKNPGGKMIIEFGPVQQMIREKRNCG